MEAGACRHKNYWPWRRERNDARWQQQERGELDFDAKNMMHTVRLLLSGRSLMESGKPMVRFEGEQLALLMSIREGRRTFDEIMTIAAGYPRRLRKTRSECGPSRNLRRRAGKRIASDNYACFGKRGHERQSP